MSRVTVVNQDKRVEKMCAFYGVIMYTKAHLPSLFPPFFALVFLRLDPLWYHRSFVTEVNNSLFPWERLKNRVKTALSVFESCQIVMAVKCCIMLS